jgi:RNA polymerase-binding transcription factor DksA
MTRKVGKLLVIEVERGAKCEDCGKIEELRPYGINGANVCFDCALKNEENAREMFVKRFRGDS